MPTAAVAAIGTVGDGQLGDGDGGTRGDLEEPGGVAAADLQDVGGPGPGRSGRR